MKAILKGKVIAASDDIVVAGGYRYFPIEHVRLELLEKAEKTPADRVCPHGVQFYHVVLDGARYERAAWIYEAPRGDLRLAANRVGFWKDVEVG